MRYPTLVKYLSEADYEKHFVKKYCNTQITTFDNIHVKFHKSNFKHAFYTSPRNKSSLKTIFDKARAKRMDWIETALKDKKAILRQGFNTVKKSIRADRRVCIVQGNYIVVIQLKSPNEAIFITAFLADSSAKNKILSNPIWK